MKRVLTVLLALAGLVTALVTALVTTPALAQELVDRVAARVNGTAILLTDVRAASGLGLVTPTPPEQALDEVVQRQLVLAEVARFPPPEPAGALVEAEAARLVAAAGAGYPALMRATGLTEARVRELARDSVRIEAYLDQRFGATVPTSDEQALQYYRDHPEEFRRDGVVASFAEVAGDARRRASLDRRRATVAQWARDLRTRAEVAIVGR